MSNKLELSDYYLDLNRIKDLSTDEQKIIHSYYTDMLAMNYEGRYEYSSSLFNTLSMGEFLKNKTQEDRNDKIVTLING